MSAIKSPSEWNKAVRIMLYLLFLALIPMIMIFIFYLQNPNSSALYTISEYASGLPSVSSTKSPLLSKLLDTYTKTAPALALLFFIFSFKFLSVIKTKKTSEMIRSLILYGIFYFIIIYVFLFCNHEISTSGKLLRTIATNDYFLTLFFISLYSSIYILSAMLLWFSFGTYKVIKER